MKIIKSNAVKASNSVGMLRMLDFGFILCFTLALILIAGASNSTADLFSQQSHGTIYYTSLSPANLTQTLNTTPVFTFISYSTTNSTYSCALYIDGTLHDENSSVQNNTETTLTVNGTLAPGDHTWYINCTDASGTYSSGTRTIGIGGNFSRCAILVDSGTYYLNDSIINSSIPSCINITANNVVLDCQGNTIDGNETTSYGIVMSGIVISRDLEELTNITIRNCTVTGWGGRAIYLRNADGNTLENLVVESESYLATVIYLLHSDNNSLSNISLSNLSMSENGIKLEESDYNNLTDITIIGSKYGVNIYYSDHTILKNVKVINNTNYDIYYFTKVNFMDCHSQFINVTGTDNKPIVFFNSSVHIQNWNNNVSEIILCGADYSTIDNLTMNHTDKKNNGLILIATKYTNITNSVFANLYRGIYLGYNVYYPMYNKFANITVTDCDVGILLRYACSNTFENITIANITSYGIYIDYTSHNNVFDKITVKNSEGIYFYNNLNNNFTNLRAENNTYGIYIIRSNSNTITNSTILGNSKYGIYIDSSSSNYIYNNLLNNSVNINFTGTIYQNNWNTTKQLGTNIYTNYYT
ncbi:MAG: hypothetical protein DRO94_02100, partial [Candidatus Altiarchaeales archaeon]